MNPSGQSLAQIGILLRGTGLVFASLVVALAGRLVWIKLTSSPEGNGLPAEYVHYSILAIKNSVAPALVCAAVVFALDTKLRERLSPLSYHGYNALLLSLFFLGLAGFGFLFGTTYSLPQETALLAWFLSLGAYATWVVTNGLDGQVRERLAGSLTAHLVLDGATAMVAFGLSYLVRFDGSVPVLHQKQMVGLLPYVVLVSLVNHSLWGVYSFIWRFTSLKEILVIAQSVASTGVVLLIVRITLLEGSPQQSVPLGVLFVFPVLVLVGMSVLRGGSRIFHIAQTGKILDIGGPRRRVVLVGAGQAGQLLVRELGSDPTFKIVGFLDDDPRKMQRVIHGYPVIGNTRSLAQILHRHQVDEVILCMPSRNNSRFRALVAECEKAGVRALSVPSLSEIILGSASIGQLRPIAMEQLLGRPRVQYDRSDQGVLEAYRGKKILVTGAAGSIGSELVRQLCDLDPSVIVLLDKDENGLYELGTEIRESRFDAVVEAIADVRDRSRIGRVFDRWKPQVVFHAAAFKHVPLMEHHPSEAILNNVVGTKNLVMAAHQSQTRSFVLVSTDKAVNPTNVMGASKRVAEKIVQRQAQLSTTHFCCVRFGNVLGSRASVVPRFQHQIRTGQNVTVTHPEMRRYFMTIPEAVQLVIQAGTLGRRGEIFVLDMGEPVRIVDLAEELIKLSGLVPGKDVEIEFTGLRPGEKLFEELMIHSEIGTRTTKYSKIFSARAIPSDWEELDAHLLALEEAARADDTRAVFQRLDVMDLGYVRKQDRTIH